MSIKVGRRGELISKEDRATISNRYHRITKAINQEFLSKGQGQNQGHTPLWQNPSPVQSHW